MKGKTYRVINIDDDHEAEAAIIARSGARTVPVVTVTDESGHEQRKRASAGTNALMQAVA